MSLVVKLEDDLGEHGEWVILSGIIPIGEDDSFPVLRGIDPFGKTIFNHLQAEAFLAEWNGQKTGRRTNPKPKPGRR